MSEPDRTVDLDVVVVLFHSDPVLLRRCVDSVARATAHAGVRARLVLVDNGGGFDARIVRDADAIPSTVIGIGENVGFGCAVNAAMAVVTAPDVLLLNPDAELDEEAVVAFRAASRRGEGLYAGTLITGGRIDPDSFIDWDFSVERALRRARLRGARSGTAGSSSSGASTDVPKASGGALWATAGLLRRFGPFDEQYFLYAEDADLSRRARSTGVAVRSVPGALVLHEASASARSHAGLVEHARADAAIRLTARHRSYVVSLAQRLELFVVTLVGVALDPDPAARAARLHRLRALRAWGLRRSAPALDATGDGPSAAERA